MDQQIDVDFKGLEEKKKFFTDILINSDGRQLSFAPESKKWNMLQLIDHLVKVERNTLDFMKRFDFARSNQKLGLLSYFNSFLLKILLLSPLKFKVPVASVEAEVKDKTLLLTEWEQLRSEMREYLNSFPLDKKDNFIFKHPSAGKLNIVQTIQFLNFHLAHHKPQIKRLIENEHFPTRSRIG